MLKFTKSQPNTIDFLYVNHLWLTIMKSTKNGWIIKKQPKTIGFPAILNY